MFSHRRRSNKSGLIWQEGKPLLKGEILLQDLQDDFLDQFYSLQQGNLWRIEYTRKHKELSLNFGIVESECMTIA
jgi:hypothetical protein